MVRDRGVGGEWENGRHDNDGAYACIYRCCIHGDVAPLRLVGESTTTGRLPSHSDPDHDTVWQLVLAPVCIRCEFW